MVNSNRPIQIVVVTVFLSILFIPLLFGHWTAEPINTDENRYSASIPKLNLLTENSQEFFDSVERYFGDRFGMRKLLLDWHNWIMYTVLGVSSSQDILLGKDGWLFWAMKKDGDPIAYLRGLKRLSFEDLSNLTTTLQTRSNWMKARNVRYLFMLAPNKSTIYPEFLPKYIIPHHKENRIDQFLQFARENELDNIVDPRTRLLNAKKEILTYHRTDSHWNSLGAYSAYLELIKTVQLDFPEIRPLKLTINDFQREPGVWSYVAPTMSLSTPIMQEKAPPLPGGDLAKMIGLQETLTDFSIIPVRPDYRCAHVVPTPYRPGGWENTAEVTHPIKAHLGLITTECNEKTLNVVVVHDSFGPLLIPYLSETFHRVTYVWGDHFDFAQEFVKNENVDLVIQVHVERHLLPGYIY